ncbi:hypothetical protein [Hyalangium minutum]|uniref:Uncharacterized protein n=1 Tax=Hyalangium minutum TaxID=394096 RepID=A0A085WW18_9BACT|nr:hypothetical protein [Hyalangium minutum]KFE71881.1 hypothetical protein DB31_0142 [Hyalangium minutum]
MLIRYSDWKRPTDDVYAFRLRTAAGAAEPGAFIPALPGVGTQSDIRDVLRRVLADGEAERFERQIDRWSGPEDVVGEAREKPYAGQQHTFEERSPSDTLTMADVDAVLRGIVLVLRGSSGATDYVLRDHHMLDVALYHYWTTGELPSALFHADRHSDWCKDSYLEARRPQQAATWWALIEGLKRPSTGAPVLSERAVFFTTAAAERSSRMSGRDIGASVRVPGFLDPEGLRWPQVLEQPGATEADWVSLDLDFFQPSPQLRVSKGLLRDARFQGLLSGARVRVFVLSPQFTNGGDRIDPWVIQGHLHSSLRLLNLLRRPLRLGVPQA